MVLVSGSSSVTGTQSKLLTIGMNMVTGDVSILVAASLNTESSFCTCSMVNSVDPALFPLMFNPQ